jgi:uncharacterized protein (DUF427 family)
MNDQVELTGPAPGFVKNPTYLVEMEPLSKRVWVKFGEEIIADSVNALVMIETNHQPVYYFPRADLRMDLMERTEHSSF